MGNVSLVLRMEVAHDRKTGTITVSQEKYTKSNPRAVWHGKLQPCEHSRFRWGAVGGTARREYVERRRNIELPSDNWLGHAPCTSYAIRHHGRYLPVCSGDVEAFQSPHGCGQTSPALLAGSADFTIVYQKGGFKLTAFADAC